MCRKFNAGRQEKEDAGVKYAVVDEIREKQNITKEQLTLILNTKDAELEDYLMKSARETARQVYGNKIYMRGLIEFTNYCRNNCYYCGIRRENRQAERYRLTEEQILSCCQNGYRLGFLRTFVLQGAKTHGIQMIVFVILFQK